MLQTIRDIESVATLCRSGQQIPDALALWLAASLESYLDRRSPSLEEAFGLQKLRGGVSWRMEAAIRARDSALRDLAAHHFAELSPCARANRIREVSLRYAASGWRFDRARHDMPPCYAGTAQEWLWKAFRSGAAMPLCSRQLRQILASI